MHVIPLMLAQTCILTRTSSLIDHAIGYSEMHIKKEALVITGNTIHF